MENFDKCMALGEIEDALTGLHSPYGHGVAVGLCGAFYMCGLLSTTEWEAFMARIPAGLRNTGNGGNHVPVSSSVEAGYRLLN